MKSPGTLRVEGPQGVRCWGERLVSKPRKRQTEMGANGGKCVSQTVGPGLAAAVSPRTMLNM